MRAPARRLRAGDHLLELGARPLLSGVLGAAPACGAGGARDGTLDAQLGLARDLLGAGADILDLEGVPRRVGLAPADAREEIERVAERVAALAERVVAELGALVSVHTDEPLVAAARSPPARASSTARVRGTGSATCAALRADRGRPRTAARARRGGARDRRGPRAAGPRPGPGAREDSGGGDRRAGRCGAPARARSSAAH